LENSAQKSERGREVVRNGMGLRRSGEKGERKESSREGDTHWFLLTPPSYEILENH